MKLRLPSGLLIWHALAGAYLLLLLYGLLWPQPAAEGVGDKTLHFVAFGGLVLVSHASISSLLGVRASRIPGGAVAVSVGYGIAVGLVSELLQAMTTYREGSIADWGADVVGAVLAGALLRWGRLG